MADDVMVCRRQGHSSPLVEHYWTQEAYTPPMQVQDFTFAHQVLPGLSTPTLQVQHKVYQPAPAPTDNDNAIVVLVWI